MKFKTITERLTVLLDLVIIKSSGGSWRAKYI
jgi:hypothetical protein